VHKYSVALQALLGNRKTKKIPEMQQLRHLRNGKQVQFKICIAVPLRHPGSFKRANFIPKSVSKIYSPAVMVGPLDLSAVEPAKRNLFGMRAI
jgi:hypothetical protein